jgi:UDP-N-acetylmuramoyl-L-alanyl-D-glutamate--2,6-diaminopimelate ligase
VLGIRSHKGTMAGSDRTNTLNGFEALGLLTSTRRAGNWSGPLPELTGLSVDSRKTEAGHLFAALPGSVMHGGQFIPYALRMGAVAVLTDAEGLRLAEAELGPLGVPVLLHDAPRRALALAAARWYEVQPETVVAVTGTNGKTSVASFTRQIWEAAGERAVNFGTTGAEGAVSAPVTHTTPEPITLHALLSSLASQGVTHAAMEASSHGLDQHRLDGVHLAAAGFTNLTRDHLDYHADVEDYIRAKLGLFERILPRSGTAVINCDDANGLRFCKVARARGQALITVGRAESHDLRILGQRFDASGQELLFSWGGRTHRARLSLIGDFQAMNALVAAGLAIGSGSAAEAAISALSELVTVRGRMQRAATRANGAAVFVDYAHTPDALKTALAALRPHVMGRLLVVFGAGGDRDPGKRPLMGAAVALGADVAFVTDDNPRSEDPAAIRAAVLAACPEANEIGDRAEAILTAVDALQPGDALLIAGKGHETGQVVGDDVLPFDDIEQASVAVAALDGLGA